MATYNVRRSDGSMAYGITESQKDTIVGTGGTVINVIRKIKGRDPAPRRAPPPPPPSVPPPSPPSAPPAPPLLPVVESTSADDLVLQARLSGLQQSLEDQLRLLSEGKITPAELARRKEVLESGHLEWFTGFEETGATLDETKLITEARAAESAAQVEETVKQILTLEAKGDITHEQSLVATEQIQEVQREEVKKILSGEDVLASESGLVLKPTFVEPEKAEPVDIGVMLQPVEVAPVTEVFAPKILVPKSVTTEVWTVTTKDPQTGEAMEHKFSSEDDAQRYVEASFTATVEPAKRAVLVESSVKPISVKLDPNLVTYLGISMTRDQFNADFPEGTLPDVPGVTPTFGEAGVAYEEAMSVVPTILRKRADILTDMATSAALSGKPLSGLLYYLGSSVYRVSATVYDTGTLPIRPEMWKQQAQALGYLLAEDKPQTRTEFNQRIADFVAGDIEDPAMRREMTTFLQTTMPFITQDLEYLDTAADYRRAVGAQIGSDPFTFALELGASLYTGHLMGKALSDVYKKLKTGGVEQAQLDKIHPISSVDDLVQDIDVPEMFRGVDLQPSPESLDGVWSAELYSTGGKWSNKASWEIAADVAEKGGQQVVYLKDPITNTVSGVMSYKDYIGMVDQNPTAFVGMGAFVAILDAGGAQNIIDGAVVAGIFEPGVFTRSVTIDRILVTVDHQSLGEMVDAFTRTELREIGSDTLVEIMPKLELGIVSKLISNLDKDQVLDTFRRLDSETVVGLVPTLSKDLVGDVVADLDRDTLLAVIPGLGKGLLVDLIPKLDKDVVQDVLLDLDRDTLLVILPLIEQSLLVAVLPQLDISVIQELLPVLDTSTIIDLTQELDDDQIIGILPKLTPAVILDVIPTLELDLAVDIITVLPDDLIITVIMALDDAQIQELIPRLEIKLRSGQLQDITRNLPRRVKHKVRQSMKRRKLKKVIRSKQREPYRISFSYDTGASETKQVEARTYHEALVIAQELKQITLVPLEVEVEKLALGTVVFEEPKKLKPSTRRSRRAAPNPEEEEAPPVIRDSGGRDRHETEGDDPRRRRKRRKRSRLVK